LRIYLDNRVIGGKYAREVKYVLAKIVPQPGFITSDFCPLVKVRWCTVLCAGVIGVK
jgi:hypothetical protein